MPENKNIELRSEEVQEILTCIPHWMIRWGNLVILIVLLTVFFMSWLIKYPDIISAEVIITTNIPPEKVIARTAGRIEAIFINDKQHVNKQTPLAVIENTANFNDVFLLKSCLDTINIENEDVIFPFYLFKNMQLGELENPFATFEKNYILNQLNQKLKPFENEKKALKLEDYQIRERLWILRQQKKINEEELILKKNELNRVETLYNKGVLTLQEFENKKLEFIQNEKNFKSLLSTISQLKSGLISNDKTINSTIINEEKELFSLENNAKQSFLFLKKSLADWELNFVLKSSILGQVTFLKYWKENQTITSGENIFTIIPSEKEGFVGKTKVAAFNSGKIRLGQKVIIRLSNFPDREFGVLKGTVGNISLTPDNEGFLLIDILLPSELKTSYNKTIPFKQEMSGKAEIITEDLRLLERLLYQFRDLIRRT
jgi:multidrug resistance efflux pump